MLQSSVSVHFIGLSIQVERVDSTRLDVRLRGGITESFDVSKALAAMKQIGMDGIKIVSFDVQAVAQLNSTGIREWIIFLQKLQPAIEVRFSVLSEAFLDSASMVDNILGCPKGKVESVQVPFCCEACEARDVVLIPVAQVVSGAKVYLQPSRKCSKCDRTMEIDCIEEEFFATLLR